MSRLLFPEFTERLCRYTFVCLVSFSTATAPPSAIRLPTAAYLVNVYDGRDSELAEQQRSVLLNQPFEQANKHIKERRPR